MTKKQMRLRCPGRFFLAFMSGLLLVAMLAALLPDIVTQSPAFAERVRPESIWQTVYERVPSLPKENQYISKETGKVETDNTLVGRFVRYHVYVAGRSPLYRFDWKLTLAEYLGLGLNGAFDETSYPSRAALRTNPADGDRAAINKLNRAQREALVQALVDAFSPTAAQSLPSSPSSGSRPDTPAIAPMPKP